MGFVKRSKLTKHSFAFSNVMTCSHCGCSITAEEKRKKSGLTYVYYHCTSGKGHCDEVTYIRQEKIESWISEALSQIQLPEEVIEWTKSALKESHQQERDLQNHQLSLLEARYKSTKNKIGRAYEEKLEGLIDHDFWSEQNSRWNRELTMIESQVSALRAANTSYMEQGVRLMELARKAPTLFKSMTPDEKRELVNLVLSNPQIKNGSLCYDFRFPFSNFVGVTTLDKWRGGRDSNPRPSA